MKRIVREDWEFAKAEWKFLMGMPMAVLLLVAFTHTGKSGLYIFSFLGMVFWALRERRREKRRDARERSGAARSTGSR